MLKRTAASSQFLERSGSFSTHGSRSGVDLLGIGVGVAEEMTPIQKRDAANAKLTALREQIVFINGELAKKLKYKQAFEYKKRRDVLGKEYKKICDLLKELNAEAKRVNRLPDLGECIISVMRERMTKPEWEIVMKEAQRRYNAATGKETA